jgi:hypothetical protein
MSTLAPQLDLFALLLAVLAAVLAPFAVLVDSAVAGRMRALGSVCHHNLLRRSLRLNAREPQANPNLSKDHPALYSIERLREEQGERGVT